MSCGASAVELGITAPDRGTSGDCGPRPDHRAGRPFAALGSIIGTLEGWLTFGEMIQLVQDAKDNERLRRCLADTDPVDFAGATPCPY